MRVAHSKFLQKLPYNEWVTIPEAATYGSCSYSTARAHLQGLLAQHRVVQLGSLPGGRHHYGRTAR